MLLGTRTSYNDIGDYPVRHVRVNCVGRASCVLRSLQLATIHRWGGDGGEVYDVIYVNYTVKRKFQYTTTDDDDGAVGGGDRYVRYI